MTNAPYEGATGDQLRNPLVREFLAIHDMFRNQLVQMVEFINDLTAGEQQLSGAETNTRIQALLRAGTQYTTMLHHHHSLESSALFPALAKDGLDSAVVARLETDHDEIAALIDNFSAAIRNLATIEPQVMDNDLRRLAEALHAHLAYEETHVCPLLARHSGWPFR
jgi:hemerythrin-like domain-containing protein